MKMPSDFQRKVWFNALTAICIVAIGAIFVGGVWLTGEVLAYLQPVLVPLAVAGITAYLLDPLVSWLEKKKRMTRLRAILVIFFIGAIAVAGFTTMIAVPLSGQVKKLSSNRTVYAEKAGKMIQELGKVDGLVEALPEPLQGFFPQEEKKEEEEFILSTEGEVVAPSLMNAYRDYMQQGAIVAPDEPEPEEEVDLSVAGLLDSFGASIPDLAKKAVEGVTRGTSKLFGVVGYSLGFVMVPIYLFFFLRDSVKIQRSWQQFIPLRASKFKDEVISVLTEINAYLISFFRGQVLVSIIDGVLVGFVLKMFGHPFAILIGIALAILGVIPFIGNVICLIPAEVTAYAHFSVESEQDWLGDNPWSYVMMVVAVFIIVQQINSLVTAPKIVGDSVGLHPMTVIFSMLFWSLLLGGFLGALLAVPMTAAVKVLFTRYVWQKRVKGELVGAVAAD